ncbi:MAG TPA: hypothetical protein VLA19_04390 [Herpetosiphonaceae bacterium]|nr:hypothetical protein [Herpetosiphonaceae bacterium]
MVSLFVTFSRQATRGEPLYKPYLKRRQVLYRQDVIHQALWQQALRRIREVGDLARLAACLEEAAHLAAAQGQAERTARLLAATAAQRERTGGQRTRVERESYEGTLLAVRSGLDEATFAAAWVEGRTMPLEQAIAYVLEDEAAAGVGN